MLPHCCAIQLAQDVCDDVLRTLAWQRKTGATVDWTAAYGHALGRVGEAAGLTSPDDLAQVEAIACCGLEALLATVQVADKENGPDQQGLCQRAGLNAFERSASAIGKPASGRA